MSVTTDPAAEQMARDLIDHVKRTHTPRLALLEDRITAVIDYMDQVERPNAHTMAHIRAYLTGGRDSLIPLVMSNKIDETEAMGAAVRRARLLVRDGGPDVLVVLPTGTQLPGVQHDDGLSMIAAVDLVAAADRGEIG